MIKRTLFTLGLGLALLGGMGAPVHASSRGGVHAATVTTDVVATDTGPQMADPDANAPCATDAAGNQTGDCQNSQNASGPEDNTGTPGSPEDNAGA